MGDCTSLILFGVRSPLVVEYEESCHRANIVIRAGISVNGAPRLLDAKLAIPFDQFSAVGVSSPFIACAFAPGRRRALALMAVEKGLVHATALIDPTAAVARSSRVGDGSFVNAGAVIGGLSFLGEGVAFKPLCISGPSLDHRRLCQYRSWCNAGEQHSRGGWNSDRRWCRHPAQCEDWFKRGDCCRLGSSQNRS